MKWFGTVGDWIEAGAVTITMQALLIVWLFVGMSYFELAYNPWEFWGTLFGLVCVWLARTKNILTWPTGIICTLCFSVLFKDVVGQQMLNLLFFTPIGFWYWYRWVKDTTTTTQELPVTRMPWDERIGCLAITAFAAMAVYVNVAIFAPWSQMPILDATVVASSVSAQILLGQRRVEAWLMWLGPVNALSIYLFYNLGWYMVMALYIAYFVHAAFAFRSWSRA